VRAQTWQAGEGNCELLISWPEERGLAGEMVRFEQEGDRITRRIIHGLHRSRIPADDRGDLYALAEAIDDVVDEIEEAAEDLTACGIGAPMPQQLAGIYQGLGTRSIAAARR
jgi:uncharacterized protein Yka (UPF0111/DUF47 family)